MKVIFEASDGRTVELYGNPYRLYHFEGFGDVYSETQMQRVPYQDGNTYVDSNLQSRTITLELRINAKNESELVSLRSYLASVFNPKLGLGKLTRIIGDDIKEIECVADSLPFFPEGAGNRGRTFQKALINLTAPFPYWRSPEVTTEPLAAFLPRFRFPFRFPVVFGERGSQATLYNDGDVPCPIEIEFNGPAQLPIVRNVTTGEFIRIEKSLNVGEKLIINTSHGRERKVIVDKGNGEIENAFHYIDIWESTLFQLAVGENVIEYDAVASGGQAVVRISYRKLYAGV